jgi:replicative DNA helicase
MVHMDASSTPDVKPSADALFDGSVDVPNPVFDTSDEVPMVDPFAGYDDGGFDEPEWDASDDEPGFEPRSTNRRTSIEVPTPIVVSTLRRVLAASHQRPALELASLVSLVRASTLVLSELPERTREVYQGVLEAFEFEVANLSPTALVDLSDIPVLANHSDAVADEVTAMYELATTGQAAKSPASTFSALAEQIQAAHARRRYQDAISLVDAKATAAEKMKAHQALIPPTTQVAVVRSTGVLTAAQLVDQHLASTAGSLGISHSSGLLTLDLAFTQPGEPLHFIAPGEQTVIAGPTGTGKSTLQYSLTRNVAQDELNWGLYDTPVILAHTEEESWVKAKAMGLFPGQPFHHLASKIYIENIGSSRRRLVEMVYDLVIAAVVKSQSTSRPITDFLPRIGFLDYIQSVSERGESDVQANITTAELILRGFQAFNPEEMAKFSGVDFRSYSGMPWPEGIEDHRMAWVVFAQLKKPADENAMFYKAASKNSQLSDFTLEDTSAVPGWVDPSGSGWAWEVRENDFRIFRQNQIMGSAKILQNATNIILLHRSRPYNNPAGEVGADGRRHLQDVRARLILDKTRNGSQMLYVPMAFDIQPDGFRAQYYDLLGEKAVGLGNVVPDEIFHQSGDPLLPRRPKPSPFAGTRY